MYKEVKYVNGPYTCSATGRKIINICFTDGGYITKPYPRFLVEFLLHRQLDKKSETIDHIDGDFTNNAWTNLRIIPMAAHIREDKLRPQKVRIQCSWCKQFTHKDARHLDHNAKQGKAGPFCSRQCAGRYSVAVKMKKVVPLPPQARIPRSDRSYKRVKDYSKTVADIAKAAGIHLSSEQDLLSSLPRYRRTVKKRSPKKHNRVGANRPTLSERTCVECGVQLTEKQKSFCSYTCANNGRRRTERPTPEELTELVWKIPTSLLAKKYGVSDKAVAKWCKAWGIEKPPRGYWAKKRAQQ